MMDKPKIALPPPRGVQVCTIILVFDLLPFVVIWLQNQLPWRSGVGNCGLLLVWVALLIWVASGLWQGKQWAWYMAVLLYAFWMLVIPLPFLIDFSPGAIESSHVAELRLSVTALAMVASCWIANAGALIALMRHRRYFGART